MWTKTIWTPKKMYINRTTLQTTVEQRVRYSKVLALYHFSNSCSCSTQLFYANSAERLDWGSSSIVDSDVCSCS